MSATPLSTVAARPQTAVPRVESFAGPAAEWDDFVRAQVGATHCHLSGWRTLIERVFGHECLQLAVRDGSGALAGILQIVRVRSRLFGHYLVSMPFLNYGGPLGSDAAVRALAQEAVRLADRDAVKLLELRSRVAMPLGLPVSHRKITVLLDLAPTPEEMMKRLPSKLRSQVRRPQKEGVSVAFGPGQLDAFHDVYSAHMRDLGTPTQSRALFQAIADTFPDDVWFAVASLDGRPIAAGCGFRFGREFEMTWASSRRAFNRLSPNMLLYWACMERAIHEGLATFNFGRCTPGGGTHRFKQQWGSRDEPLWWYAHSPSGAPTGMPSQDQGAFALATRVWQRIPVPVARLLGPAIVRYIP